MTFGGDEDAVTCQALC